LVEVEANVEREENEVRVEFEKRPMVELPKSEGVCVDEELETPVNVEKADELLEGVDVSVSEDADKEDDKVSDSAEVVDDGAPSVRSGSRPERDTLGNASPMAVRAAVTTAGKAGVGGATESEVRVSTLVTAPVASM
jgi:hypothetical protein